MPLRLSTALKSSLGEPNRKALGFTGAAVTLALTGLMVGTAFAQDVGWPTPPAGPPFSIPSEQAMQAQITDSVESPGAVVHVVPASWPGPLPLIPPIQTTELLFMDSSWSALPLTLWVDAGTFAEVVQVRVAPVETSELPDIDALLLFGFQIEFFDARGKRLSAAPQRPIRVDVPAAAVTASGVDGKSLLFWLQADSEPIPLLTSFNTISEILTARLISPGILVLADES